MKNSLKAGLDKIRIAWEENPLTVIGIGIAATLAVSKLIDSVSAAQGRRAYARQIDYKVKHRK